MIEIFSGSGDVTRERVFDAEVTPVQNVNFLVVLMECYNFGNSVAIGVGAGIELWGWH